MAAKSHYMAFLLAISLAANCIFALGNDGRPSLETEKCALRMSEMPTSNTGASEGARLEEAKATQSVKASEFLRACPTIGAAALRFESPKLAQQSIHPLFVKSCSSLRSLEVRLQL